MSAYVLAYTKRKEGQKISIRKRKGMKRTLLILSVLATALMVFAGCKKEPKVEEITSVKVDPTAVILKPGDSKQLKVSWEPQTKNVTALFTSDKPEVATVDADGMVKAVAEGTATITVNVGNKKATCAVTVSNETNVTEVKVDPTSVTVPAGKTTELTVTWEPKALAVTPTFASDKPEVATVSDKGVITGVAEGKAVITVTVGALKATCDVTVTKAAESPKNQLPAMCFNSGNGHPQIQANEKALGRELKSDVVVQIEKGVKAKFDAFVNPNLDIFPVASYGLALDDGKGGNMDAIIVLGKESIDDCDATVEMIKENGFPDVQIKEMEGKLYIFGHSEDGKITVMGREMSILGIEGQPDTEIIITFSRKAGLPTKFHDCIPTAKDFPSWEAFITKDSEKIKAFEAKLGLRAYNEGYSTPLKNNLDFELIPEKAAETNLDWVFYQGTTEKGEPFINACPNFIDQVGQVGSEEVKNWLATNGFDTDYRKKGNDCFAFNKDKTVGAVVFINKSQTAARLQIMDAKETKSTAQMMRLKKLAFDPRNGELQYYKSLKLSAKH